MNISRLFLFGFLAVFNCASPATETTPDADLGIDSGKDMGAKIIDTSDDLTAVEDLKETDVDREKYEMCFADGVVQVAQVEPSILDEISGIAVSRSQQIIWAHNDSGDEDGQFYAIDFDGKLRGTFVLKNAKSKDWEDMSIVEQDGKSYLYFGDTGDNDARAGNEGRSKVRVYRIEEPTVDLSATPNVAIEIEDYHTYTFTYPDGATDCESLFADPRTGDLFFLEKKNAGFVHFFRAPKPIDGSTTILEKLDGIDISSLDYPGSMTTAGSISKDGKWIVVRTYNSVLLFPWRQDETFSAAVSIAPIVLPVPREIQGEAIDFADLNGESGLITISEGVNPAINFTKDTCK